jgi:hypothetical protein
MEIVLKQKGIPNKSILMDKNSKSSDGDGFYPKTPEALSRDHEKLS